MSSRYRRTYCYWRNAVNDGVRYQSLDDFPDDRCVLISPLWARYTYTGRALPYWQVDAGLRRHIWSTFTHAKVPPHACIPLSPGSAIIHHINSKVLHIKLA